MICMLILYFPMKFPHNIYTAYASNFVYLLVSFLFVKCELTNSLTHCNLFINSSYIIIYHIFVEGRHKVGGLIDKSV